MHEKLEEAIQFFQKEADNHKKHIKSLLSHIKDENAEMQHHLDALIEKINYEFESTDSFSAETDDISRFGSDYVIQSIYCDDIKFDLEQDFYLLNVTREKFSFLLDVKMDIQAVCDFSLYYEGGEEDVHVGNIEDAIQETVNATLLITIARKGGSGENDFFIDASIEDFPILMFPNVETELLLCLEDPTHERY